MQQLLICLIACFAYRAYVSLILLLRQTKTTKIKVDFSLITQSLFKCWTFESLTDDRHGL